jgi:hypothetical protein
VGQEGELRPMADPQASKEKMIEGLPFKGGGVCRVMDGPYQRVMDDHS